MRYESTVRARKRGYFFKAIIKALEQEQSFKWCTDCKEYDQEKHCCHRWSKVIRDTVEEMKQEQEPILDELRAEIKHFMYDVNPSSSESDYACNYILQIIDKYKAESEKTDGYRVGS